MATQAIREKVTPAPDSEIVIPAKAGTQTSPLLLFRAAVKSEDKGESWAPAFAGVTIPKGASKAGITVFHTRLTSAVLSPAAITYCRPPDQWQARDPSPAPRSR